MFDPVPAIVVKDELTRGGRVARVICLNRPERRNSLRVEDLIGLEAAISTAGDRMLILTGASGAFCAGLDLKMLAGAEDLHGAIVESLTRLTRVYDRLIRHPKATLAWVSGAAAGGGWGLAAACDRIVASRDATFLLPGGALSALAGVVIPVLARRWSAAEGAVRWGVSEAVAHNLVDRIVDGAPDLLAEADRVADEQLPPRIGLDGAAMTERLAAAVDASLVPVLREALRRDFA